jgi:hypothetical protein
LCQNPGSGFVTIGGDCNDNNDLHIWNSS